MNIAYTNSQDFSFFSDAKVQLEQIINKLQSKNSRNKEHGDIEKYIDIEGREIFRCLLQGWLDIKNTNEVQYDYIHSNNEQQKRTYPQLSTFKTKKPLVTSYLRMAAFNRWTNKSSTAWESTPLKPLTCGSLIPSRSNSKSLSINALIKALMISVFGIL